MNPSPTDNTWYPVPRIVWLTGGLVAVNKTGATVTIHSGLEGKVLQTLEIRTYGSLFAGVRSLGYQLVGCSFFTDRDQITGLRDPDFRVCGVRSGWPVFDLWDKWRGISHGASLAKDMRLMDVAARIASGLFFSQLRVSDLASAYSAQLRHKMIRDEPMEYQPFQDMHNYNVIKTIHALFWEMAVLRDALAEFAATYCFSQAGITTLSGLIKVLGGYPDDPLAKELSQATDQRSGWMAKFTSYRNCFTHVAPLAQVTPHSKYAIQDLRTLLDGGKVPQIYYPLPDDVEAIMKSRSQGLNSNSTEQLVALFKRRHNRTSEPDALEYLYDCLNRMADLASQLSLRSPIAPRPVVITKADIIGEIRVSYQ